MKRLSDLDLYFKILFFFFKYFNFFQTKQILNINSTGGSVVEFSPATREARVRFPASANYFLLKPVFNLFDLNCMLYLNGCFHSKHRFRRCIGVAHFLVYLFQLFTLFLIGCFDMKYLSDLDLYFKIPFF